ncbi:MAG: sulfite exporter TauE/SafE family protein [Pseudomonadales bacterium]|nr:sulfite exporter TauE/SafE family protein [Pseudomonadales bacterium]
MDYSFLSIALLAGTGFLAGGINTIAGGGSNLTLPALMMMGLPADVANGTNRVAVLMQCIVGVRGYDKHDTLDRGAIKAILFPTMTGGILGALAAAMMPNLYLKPVLLLTILSMSLVILLRPSVIAPPPGTPTKSPNDSPLAWWSLFAAGIYGGFVQAGVGFILLGALAGALRYDLVRANALKMTCALAFTAVAFVVFVAFGQVRWIPGLIVACGSMLGAHLTVKIAVKASQNSIKWFLFLMTLCAVAGGFLF